LNRPQPKLGRRLRQIAPRKVVVQARSERRHPYHAQFRQTRPLAQYARKFRNRFPHSSDRLQKEMVHHLKFADSIREKRHAGRARSMPDDPPGAPTRAPASGIAEASPPKGGGGGISFPRFRP
jgi:hypothetical protein